MSTMDNTFGLLLQAALYSCVLYGASAMQAWSYFRRYHKRDSPWVQSLIALILICDTCQIGFLCAALYTWLITNHSDPAILGFLPHTLIIQLFFSATMSICVQQFYCYRIWQLSKSVVLAAIVSAVSWSAFITLLIYTTDAIKFTQIADLALLQKMSTITNSLAACADVIISIVLVILLQKSKTGFKRTEDLVNRLILFTFNAGLPTSVCALVAVITINAAPLTFLYIFFFIIMGRFYINSILVTLNTRDYIRDKIASSRGGSEGTAQSRSAYTLSPVPGGVRPAQSAGGPDSGWRVRSENNDILAIRVDTSFVNDQKAFDNKSPRAF